MRLIYLLAAVTALSACGQSNLANQQDDYGTTGEIVDMRPTPTPLTAPQPPSGAGASSSELRNVAPVVAGGPSQSASRSAAPKPRFVDLATEDGTRPGVSRSVIRDRATGCEYVITNLYGEDLSAERRMESTSQGTAVQRCVRTTAGSGYVWIGLDLPVQVSTVRDTQTGCDYVYGTMFGQASFMMPRMERTGAGDSAPMCRPRDPSGSEG